MGIRREKWLKVRLSDEEHKKLQQFADSKFQTQAQAVRTWIHRLPVR
jgi:predicted DNA-binding protein